MLWWTAEKCSPAARVPGKSPTITAPGLIAFVRSQRRPKRSRRARERTKTGQDLPAVRPRTGATKIDAKLRGWPPVYGKIVGCASQRSLRLKPLINLSCQLGRPFSLVSHRRRARGPSHTRARDRVATFASLFLYFLGRFLRPARPAMKGFPLLTGTG